MSRYVCSFVGFPLPLISSCGDQSIDTKTEEAMGSVIGVERRLRKEAMKVGGVKEVCLETLE